MISEGRPFHNPWGTPLFSSLFFSITGCTCLHVTGGVVALIAVVSATRGDVYNLDEYKSGLYWHFVDRFGCSSCRSSIRMTFKSVS